MKNGLRFVVSVLFISSLCVVFLPREGMGKEGYAGTASCVVCHKEQQKAYEAHAHAGVTGKWAEEGQEKGIGCESCHGPGKAHADLGANALQDLKKNKGDMKILWRNNNKNDEFCMPCHRLTDNDNILLAGDYLIKYGQEYSELSRSKKAQFKVTCGACHDPHLTVQNRVGIKRKCLDCHKGKFAIEIKIPEMSKLTCEACHMPKAVTKETGTRVNADYIKGEHFAHVFGISVDPAYTLNDGTDHISLTKEGLGRLTVEMTCYACHKTGVSPDMPRDRLIEAAKKIH